MISTQYPDLIKKLLPPNRWKQRRLDLLRSLLSPIAEVNSTFASHTSEVQHDLDHPKQTIYFLKWLNDIYDLDLRRIWLEHDDMVNHEDPSLFIYITDHILLDQGEFKRRVYSHILRGVRWELIREAIIADGSFNEQWLRWMIINNPANAAVSITGGEFKAVHSSAGSAEIENRYAYIDTFKAYKLSMTVETNSAGGSVSLKVENNSLLSIECKTTATIASPTVVIRKGISDLSDISVVRLESIMGGAGTGTVSEVKIIREPYLFEWDFKDGIDGFVFINPTGLHAATFDHGVKALKLSTSSGSSNIESFIHHKDLLLTSGKKFHAYMVISSSTHANVKAALALDITDTTSTEQNTAGTYIDRSNLQSSSLKLRFGIRLKTSIAGHIFIHKIGIIQHD